MITKREDKIFFLDLKEQFKGIKDEIFAAFEEVCVNTAFTDGPFARKFENNYSEYCEVNFTAACNNGTTALHLAMMALGIKEGDEVIMPANTFIATPWAVSYVGAKPVFVDCDPDTWEIDENKIEAAITENTKAIIGVHLYGQPFEVDAVRKIAVKHNLHLVEDAAQAQGARYKGNRTGGLCDIGCFSFYPGKNLGATGEGGAVTTNSQEYDTHIRRLRNHGSDKKYYHVEIGYNYRMGGLESASLNVKLKHLDKWNNRRREIASMYNSKIYNPKIKMQSTPDYIESVYHLFVITTDNREDFIKHLNDWNIFPGMHYPVPCHLQEAYKHLGYSEGDFKNSEYLASHCVSLPIYPELNEEKVNYIIDCINQY